MTSKKPLVYAPGITQSRYVSNSNYTGDHCRLIEVFNRSGFDFYFFQPDWRNPRPLEWAASMAKLAIRVANKANQGVVMAGFSAGGLTAVLAADLLQQSENIKVDGLVGCSFSPWFGLDHVLQAHTFPRSDVHVLSEALKASLSDLTLPKVNCTAQLYAGAQEITTIHKVRDDARRQWPRTETITPACGHNIFHDSYLQALSHNVGRLALPHTV